MYQTYRSSFVQLTMHVVGTDPGHNTYGTIPANFAELWPFMFLLLTIDVLLSVALRYLHGPVAYRPKLVRHATFEGPRNQPPQISLRGVRCFACSVY